ncbi:hypothetical protein [Streptomyces sp. YIM 98790]|uniref:hypothetical protein n=1 Tax=Streptomyces sp. YIM 98790 TaxID=2689077 RepID=UPI00140C5437|nr:hypothetical protein [Streptomyces sp. YIM 98790]
MAGLQFDEEEIARSLRDSDEALRVWYTSLMSPKDDDLVLTGVPLPSFGRMGELFDQWFERNRALLRQALCGKLHKARLSAGGKDLTEVGVVAVIAAALAASSVPIPVDPLATAVVLLARGRLEKLCGEPAGTGAGE